MSTAAELEAQIVGARPGVQSAPVPVQQPTSPISGVDLIGRRVLTIHGPAPLDDLQYSMIVSIAVEAVKDMFQARLVELSNSLGVATHESVAKQAVDVMRGIGTPAPSGLAPADDDLDGIDGGDDGEELVPVPSKRTKR